MATEAWKPEAGQVCISMSKYGSGNMDVTFSGQKGNFWDIWEAQVWIGDNVEEVPVSESDASQFPFDSKTSGVGQVGRLCGPAFHGRLQLYVGAAGCCTDPSTRDRQAFACTHSHSRSNSGFWTDSGS